MTRKTKAEAPAATPTTPEALHPDPHVWIKDLGIKTTADVEVPKRLIDQVLGQEAAVAVAQKAAEQKRHLMLIGDPGTGKSMLAKAMAEILPPERQQDLLVYHNTKNPNGPKIHKTQGGDGRPLVQKYETKARRSVLVGRIMDWVIAAGIMGIGLWVFIRSGYNEVMVLGLMLLVAILFLYFRSQTKAKADMLVPKLLVEHAKEAEQAPYVEGTGAHAGALLGDVRHDPFQSGGLETPPHMRVEIGAIHRAHLGVLFIDEINVLRLESQQALLTALQEKSYSIVGQSERSSGAMVRTDPVPCDFILVAAGNLDAVKAPDPLLRGGMHPALRSRIRGYGYEVYVNSQMEDTHENRKKLIQFVAQEVVRDGKIPHFESGAVAEIIREGQRRAGRAGKLTLRLRELGGMVRTAGDIAREEKTEFVTTQHVRMAKGISRSLEQQITDKEIEAHLAEQALQTQGQLIGTAKGVGLIGTGEVGEPAGVVIPIEAAVVPALSRHGGNIIIGPGLRDRVGAAVENVGALLKALRGASIADHDIHVDAMVKHPSTDTEGIGIAVAVATISALERLPIKQEYVIVGSLAINGELRAVRSSLQRVEAAAQIGYKYAVVPAHAERDVLLDEYFQKKIQLIFADSLGQVLDAVLDGPAEKKRALNNRLAAANLYTSNGKGSHTVSVTTVNATGGKTVIKKETGPGNN